jgi:hypothetical protein
MYICLTFFVYALLMPMVSARRIYRPSRTLDSSPSLQAHSDLVRTPFHVSTFTNTVRDLLIRVAQPTVRAWHL